MFIMSHTSGYHCFVDAKMPYHYHLPMRVRDSDAIMLGVDRHRATVAATNNQPIVLGKTRPSFKLIQWS